MKEKTCEDKGYRCIFINTGEIARCKFCGQKTMADKEFSYNIEELPAEWRANSINKYNEK